MDQELSSPSPTPGPAEADRRPAAPRRRAADPDWIDAQLRSLYEAVVAEPLPPELRALVERLDEAPPAAPTAPAAPRASGGA
ncbi:NepR family anti-sigma factor [Stella sp.]|uniref:NepR family anti-sigma factor n=1 Tax=Stella sp. TaxID=2912054 RepID=UPI0035B304EE